MELSQEDQLKIEKKLKVGSCPNCGFVGNKELCMEEFHLTGFNRQELHTVGLKSMATFPVVMAYCPQCGYVSLFNKKFLCNDM